MIIAQLSDFHLRTDGELLKGKVCSETALDAMVAHVQAMVPQPDVILVTGDLVNKIPYRDYAAVRARLEQFGAPVYVVPGNHDDRDGLRQAFGDWGYLPPDGDHLAYAIDDHPLRLVGLDTLIVGKDGGGLGADQLAWLDDTLAARPDAPTALFMHHPPFLTGVSFMDRLPFKGAAEFDALIRRHPQVKALICGHLHRWLTTAFGGVIATSAPSSAFQMALDLRPGVGSSFVLEPAACPVFHWSPEIGLTAFTDIVGDYGPRHPFRSEKPGIDVLARNALASAASR